MKNQVLQKLRELGFEAEELAPRFPDCPPEWAVGGTIKSSFGATFHVEITREDNMLWMTAKKPNGRFGVYENITLNRAFYVINRILEDNDAYGEWHHED